jgi:hypothetical protein
MEITLLFLFVPILYFGFFYSRHKIFFYISLALLWLHYYFFALLNNIGREIKLNNDLPGSLFAAMIILTGFYLLFWTGLLGLMLAGILKLKKQKCKTVLWLSVIFIGLGLVYYLVTALGLDPFTPSCIGTFYGCTLTNVPSLQL